jgi:hypothetical protein
MRLTQGHLVAGAREYDYDVVTVTSGMNGRGFLAPRSVASDSTGVHVIDGHGRTFDFPPGSTVTHGQGKHYVLPGQVLPSSFSEAHFVRTLTNADI